MRISEKRKLYLKQIDIHISELEKGLEVLLYSYEKCRAIKGNKSEYNADELEALEAFSARFARAARYRRKPQRILFKSTFGLIS